MSVSAKDDPSADAFGTSLHNVDRTRTDAAVGGYVIEPKSGIVLWRCMAKKHFVSIHKRGRHAGHPVEVLALKLPEIAPSRGAHLTEFNENSILVSSHRRKAPLNQQIRSSGRLERAAHMIAKVQHLSNAEGGYVCEHGLKRRAIPVYICDCSKLH
jgi:hypothetical protein